MSNQKSNFLTDSCVNSIGINIKDLTLYGVGSGGDTYLNINGNYPYNYDFFSNFLKYESCDLGYLISIFKKCLEENFSLAIRNLLYLRDARSGAGRRSIFHKILIALSNSDVLPRVINVVPKIGRFDDLLIDWKSKRGVDFAVARYLAGYNNPDEIGLVCKWSPRKGIWAARLRNALGYSPKKYRKFIVSNSNTVEQLMCKNEWDNIEYSNVPSIAHNNYRKAFIRHSPTSYQDYLNSLSTGNTKVNNKIEPYELAKKVEDADSLELEAIDLTFNSYENVFSKTLNVLPMVDVSPSMRNKSIKGLTCKDIAMSLGLYTSFKNEGAFNGYVCTFSEKPVFINYNGKSFSKCVNDLTNQDWGMTTNIQSAFKEMYSIARNKKCGNHDIPDAILIFSDMCFNEGSQLSMNQYDKFKAIANSYGFSKVPKVVFWNLSLNDSNANVDSKTAGVIELSGFSKNMMTSLSEIISEDIIFTPMSFMVQTLLSNRYSF